VLQKTLRLAQTWKHDGARVVSRMPVFPKQKEQGGRIRVLSADEERAMLSAFADAGRTDALHFFAVLLDTGCRVQELAGAFNARQVDDTIVAARAMAGLHAYSEVDLSARTLRVWQSKGGKPRGVPLTDRAVLILEARRFGVMPFHFATPSWVRCQWDWMKAALGLAGDTDFVPHCLRHTCATRILEGTGDIFMVKEWLGHASVTTTQRYAHMSTQRLAAGLAALQK